MRLIPAIIIALSAALFAPTDAIPLLSRQTQDAFKSVRDTYAFALNVFNARTAVNVSASAFYRTPANFSSTTSKPGDLLKFEQISRSPLDAQYAYPPSLTLYRFMYVSLDINKAPVPATGFVLLPYYASSKVSAGNSTTKIRSVVWTHGTAGVTRDCAPSLRRSLYYDFQGVFELANSGFAVIGPDYAGLGSDTQFDYEAGVPHADDASYSAVAIRKSPIAKLLTYEWAAVGHSEGGMVAWYVNEAEAERPVGGFLGSVPIAPSLFTAVPDNITFTQPNATDGLPAIVQGSDPAPNATGQIPIPVDSGIYYTFFSLQSAAKLNASINPETYLTEKGKVMHRLLNQGGCVLAGTFITAGGNTSELFLDEINDITAVWSQRVQPSGGTRKLGGPMLIVSSVGDVLVGVDGSAAAGRGNARANPGSRIAHHIFPDLSHDGIMYGGKISYIEFLENAFANNTALLPKVGYEETFVKPVTATFGTQLNFAL
ncbi:hypothetical protein M427DRAFT_71344 [Gonapodya prolifera JEL478]|uniref:Alpha/beta-hydrolase n=1 Tax=Gonapodya prolifera (strain JEL478) TaxID=1344416 RepID=A0A139A974_GONPJ|nr:hypothetical protein M427DRAFT_71344 [Gonapodya prolifera JEL478]|eukprot:KXS13350.1 hypothetical protein M427DRAFT_71344 [Gonapodya prolifera JEL478]